MRKPAPSLAQSVRRPVDRGYVVDWGLQAETIQRAVQEVLGCGTRGSHMVVTEPLFNFRALQDIMCQTLFEDLSVASFVAAPAACLGDCRRVSADVVSTRGCTLSEVHKIPRDAYLPRCVPPRSSPAS